MSGTVVPLKAQPEGVVVGDAVNHSAVALLERWLEAARRGEIDGIALAMSRPNGRVVTDWSSTPDETSFRLAAAVTALFGRWCKRLVDCGDDL